MLSLASNGAGAFRHGSIHPTFGSADSAHDPQFGGISPLRPHAQSATVPPLPKVFHWNGLRFHFYSEVGDPHEPDYIHIRKGRDNAKFWLHREVIMA